MLKFDTFSKPIALLLYSLLCCVGLLLLCWVWYFHYLDFTYTLLQSFHKIEKLAQFRSLILTPVKFWLLRILITCFWVWFCIKHKAIIQLISLTSASFLAFMGCFKRHIVQLWTTLSWGKQSLLLISFGALMLFKIVLCLQLPLHTDELFSFVHLSSKGVVLTSTYYPGPNNHVFYNQLVAIAYALHVPALIAIRLPSMVAGGILFLLLFFYVLYRFDFSLAIILSTMVSFSVQVMSFTTQGRGYGWQLLCMSIAIISLFEWFRYGQEKYMKTIFIGASVLGFYTVPTYLYLFVSMLVFASIIGDKVHYKKLLVTVVYVGTLVVILYAPILFFNGWDALVNNAWVQAIDRHLWWYQLPTYAKKLLGMFWHTSSGSSIWLTAAFLFGCLYMKPLRKWLCFLLIPLGMIAIQRVLPYPRVFTFQAAFVWAGLAYMINSLSKKGFYARVTLGLFFLAMGYNAYCWTTILNQTHSPYEQQLEEVIATVPRYKKLDLLVLEEKLGLKLSFLAITNPAYQAVSVDFSSIEHKKYDHVYPVMP
jgi:hypothetical protein